MKTEDQGQGRGRAVGRRRGREQKRAAESAPRGAASAGWCTPPTPSAAWRPRDPQLAGGGARPKVELVHHVGHVHPGVVKGVARGARSEVERARDLGEGWGIQGWSAFSSSGGFGGFGGARLRQLVGAALAPLLPALGAASPFFCAAPSSPGQSPPCCSRGLGGRPGGRRQHNAGAGGKGVGPWCRHRPEKQGSAEAAPPTLLAAQCGPRGGGGRARRPRPFCLAPPRAQTHHEQAVLVVRQPRGGHEAVRKRLQRLLGAVPLVGLVLGALALGGQSGSTAVWGDGVWVSSRGAAGRIQPGAGHRSNKGSVPARPRAYGRAQGPEAGPAPCNGAPEAKAAHGEPGQGRTRKPERVGARPTNQARPGGGKGARKAAGNPTSR